MTQKPQTTARRAATKKPATEAAPKRTRKKATTAKAGSGKSGGGSGGKTARTKRLVVVESPAKARTIGKYLGPGFTVKASVGHIKDLPKSRMGVDVDDGFAPEYVVLRDKRKVISELKSAAKAAEEVFLAPDPDREGEAIAWHIAEVLGKDAKAIVRVTFNEITKTAVLKALEHPGTIDIDRVNAQQTRRILDRMM
ncbi:MAG TPA: toprim domain-containing protein, partial [Kofleriaceae bacterium]|nr:toprim domain-containing protein [Kofleriaceae bacterium]